MGEVTTVGNAFEWTSLAPEPLHVSLTPEDEHTRLQVIAHCGSWGAAFYLWSGMLALMVSLSLGGALDPAARVTMAHELTHALQDQRFGISGFHPDNSGQA